MRLTQRLRQLPERSYWSRCGIIIREVERALKAQILLALEKSGKIKLAVIGGYAVQAYARAYRFTKDIDLFCSGVGRDAAVKFIEMWHK